MKKLLKVALVAVTLLLVGNFTHAQTKIGYINFNALITQMPEAKTVKSQIDIYQKQFIDQLTAMNTELQTKGQAFQSQTATMTDAVRAAKQAELQDIQKRMQDFQNNAQQQRPTFAPVPMARGQRGRSLRRHSRMSFTKATTLAELLAGSQRPRHGRRRFTRSGLALRVTL